MPIFLALEHYCGAQVALVAIAALLFYLAVARRQPSHQPAANILGKKKRTEPKEQATAEGKEGKEEKEEKDGGGCVVRDVLYEYVELSGLALKFIDTPEFQGLRDLKQLGSTAYVFPSANHTRFEHSIGVYHLAGRMVSRLLQQQPHLPTIGSKDRFVEMVRLAGLLHDVGHFAGSHSFDEDIAERIGVPHHEERGVQMIRSMVKTHKIPVTDAEVDFVCGLILGSDEVEPEWVRGIVHNRECELDTDKLDYVMRDSWSLCLGRPIQVERLLLNIRVLPTKSDEKGGVGLRVCYADKVFLQVCDVFQSRYRLFREVYRHRVVLGVEEMVASLMRFLIPVIREWLKKGVRPTDAAIWSIPHWLPFVPDNLISDGDKKAILVLWKRLRSRELYKAVPVAEDKATVHVRLGLSALADDPVEKVWFYDKDDSVHHIRIHDVTKLMGASPRVASETIHYAIQYD